MTARKSYTPPLGTGSTRDYDRVIRLWTRETRWRSAMLAAVAARPDETIVDVGCGTGSFALMLKLAEPRLTVIGIDPDAEALEIARGKTRTTQADIEWRQGFAMDLQAGMAHAAVSSLVLHQMPVGEKAATLRAMHRVLRPGGRLVIADYGRQRGVMRLLFRLTVQRLDGVSDTRPNADGVIPKLIAAAGFEDVAEPFMISTITGAIQLFTARRPISDIQRSVANDPD
ncbi:class I SAM-dependent methyltransferase [Novosphingobium soli]|uniref:Class I SAM-dependent methyltransferase n=1 Tax=Novosphingobium soli TaxID=574956 RepID=A0ABV6CRC5_9SPHN